MTRMDMPSEESLMFARSVEALRVGVEALGDGWRCFPEVWNPCEKYAVKTAVIRVRFGSVGLIETFEQDGCDPAKIHDLLDRIAEFAPALSVSSESLERGHGALALQWNEWTLEQMRKAFAS